MKWITSFAIVLITVQSTLANPVKRATANDVATLGYGAGTTGGSGGTTTTVTTLAELTAAVTGDAPKIVFISGTISGSAVVKVGSNTSVIGKSGSKLDGIGLRVLSVSNVIIRNVKISKVLADVGDAIGVQEASKVWIDHNDLEGDRAQDDKDLYDGLLDITHGCTAVTVTYNRLHNHWKASLVGHSDSNSAEDKAITVTYAYNVFDDINSRTPSFRFGTGHIFNNYFTTVGDGINTRVGAQLLVENNYFTSTKKALYSTDGGYAVERGNIFGDAIHDAPVGTLTSVPYTYSLVAADTVQAFTAEAGATLPF